MATSQISRPKTPTSTAASPGGDTLAAIPETPTKEPHPPRRSSLGFLRRTKSGELGRKKSGTKLSKRQRHEEAEEERRRLEATKIPPKLPDIYNGAPPPVINTFGGEESPRGTTMRRPIYSGRTSVDNHGSGPLGVPIPPIPANSPKFNRDQPFDPYARTESMAHRGRHSYASSAISTINSPRRVRRRKDPTPFNILVIGAKSSGKTSFLNFLRTSLALPSKRRGHMKVEEPETGALPRSPETINSDFQSSYIETEIDGERVGLTLWDSPGLDRSVVDLQLREVSSFLESKFEETFAEEMKVVRSPGVQDTHIHCVFLILDPVRLDANVTATRNNFLKAGRNGVSGKLPVGVGGLDEALDLQVLRTLQGKTTVVPVISKADTITTAHMAYLKKTVWDSLKRANLDPLEALGLDDFEIGDDDDDAASDGSSLIIKQTGSLTLEKPLERPVANNSNEVKTPTTPTPPIPEEEEPKDGMLSPEPASIPIPRTPEGPSNGHANGRLATSPLSAPPTTPLPTPTPAAAPVSGNGSNASSYDAHSPYLPLSIISPDMYDPGTVGRRFPWGFADPYNVEHCDFVRLKGAVFSEWRGELREASRELWYERWRTNRLKRRTDRR